MSKAKTPADPHAVTVDPWPKTDRIAPADAQLAVDEAVAAHNRAELAAAEARHAYELNRQLAEGETRLGVKIVKP